MVTKSTEKMGQFFVDPVSNSFTLRAPWRKEGKWGRKREMRIISKTSSWRRTCACLWGRPWQSSSCCCQTATTTTQVSRMQRVRESVWSKSLSSSILPHSIVLGVPILQRPLTLSLSLMDVHTLFLSLFLSLFTCVYVCSSALVTPTPTLPPSPHPLCVRTSRQWLERLRAFPLCNEKIKFCNKKVFVGSEAPKKEILLSCCWVLFRFVSCESRLVSRCRIRQSFIPRRRLEINSRCLSFHHYYLNVRTHICSSTLHEMILGSGDI